MPIRTPHYRLEAFTWGDSYSASSDRRRFTIIDNQMAFISDIVGEGRILGWNIVEGVFEDPSIGDTLAINVLPGMGIIEKRVLQSFGILEYTVQNNTVKYIYIKKKEGVIGGASGYSNIGSVVASNLIPPDNPKNLIEIVSLRSYNQLAFSWDANTESDFSHYLIKRYNDEVYGGLLEMGQTTEITYIDENLVQDSSYTYQVIAVDLSGNMSSPVEISLRTNPDTRIPIAPIFMQIFSRDEFLQVIWDSSSSTTVIEYRVEVQQLNNFGNEVGVSYSLSVDLTDEDFGSQMAIIRDLSNDEDYRISIYAVSYTGIESNVISSIGRPAYKDGSGEVSCADISFEQSDFEQVKMEADVKWSYQGYYSDDPYIPDRPFPEEYWITFIENGRRVSEPISLLSSENKVNCNNFDCGGQSIVGDDCFNYHLLFIPFEKEDGTISYESFKEYVPYLLIIQTVDTDGNVSSGIIKRINRTPTYTLLSSITDFNIERLPDNSVSIMWTNPESRFFDYNLLTVNIVDLTGTEDNLFADDVNIEKITNYVIPSQYFGINTRYDIIVKSVDIFGRIGDQYSGAKRFTESDQETLTPSAPANVTAFSGDKQVTLTWNFNTEDSFISSYKIYRADYTLYLKLTDFSSVGSVSSDQNYFVDNSVDNGNRYTYLVVSVDNYGNESYDVTVSLPASFTVGPVTPVQSSFFSIPENLVVSIIADNELGSQLIWDYSAEVFDGYEVFKSVGNNYSFSLIGYATSSDTSYIDANGILKNEETYYYMIRKFRNEVDLFVTESTIPPSNAIIMGSVATDISGNMVIDNTLATELLNYEDPIRTKTREELADHNHKLDSNGDRRIELRSNAFVDEWVTVDYRTYSTEVDIDGATSYIVRITGDINEDYFVDDNGNTDVVSLRQTQQGVSPVLYNVDGGSGTLIFNDILYTICEEPLPDSEFVTLNPDAGPQCPKVPYLSPPLITVQLIGIEETSNTLSADRIDSLDATQFKSGEISIHQLPIVDHRGRVKERLLPLRLPMETRDNFLYNLIYTYTNDDRNKMGDSVTFYDILKIEDSKILAATSSGIWYSSDLGSSWPSNKKISMPEAVYRLYKSSIGDYFAVTNYGVYKNDGVDFSLWTKMDGLDHVKAIRDITGDTVGNVYISTDLGVFRLNRDVPYIEDTWEQLSITGVRSNDIYGLLYHSNKTVDIDPSINYSDRLIISNELGILQSFNQGRSWEFITDLNVSVKIYSFAKEGDYIFALANKAIYRQNYSAFLGDWTDFVKIAELDVKKSRKILIFNDRIYITTDEGIKVSLITSNIYRDFLI